MVVQSFEPLMKQLALEVLIVHEVDVREACQLVWSKARIGLDLRSRVLASSGTDDFGVRLVVPAAAAVAAVASQSRAAVTFFYVLVLFE